MRGCGHKDIEATKARKFLNPDSYVSVRTTADGRPKEILIGIDWRLRRSAVYARDGLKCVKCKTPYWRAPIDPHHIIKRSDGGDDHMENIVTLCRKCHKKLKGHPQWTRKASAA